MELAEYCRELEAYLCRRNDGHLMRIVGPSFEIVSGWAQSGVPLKVAMAGIDRYFERYYRKGPRRRPVKIDFCAADVLDVFDEWRRATGVTAAAAVGVLPADAAEPGDATPVDGTAGRRGPSLRQHLERVLARLSSLRATGAIPADFDAVIDTVSAELDLARQAPVRGEARRATIARLEALDRQLLGMALQSADPQTQSEVSREAADELAPFRHSMADDAYRTAVARLTGRLLRDRLRLPVVAFV